MLRSDGNILDTLRILMDALDEVCAIGDSIMAALEDYTTRLESVRGVKLSDPDSMERMLEMLTPDRAARLMVALVTLAELMPPDVGSLDDRLKENQMVFDKLKQVSRALHGALDGLEVP